MKEKNGFTLQNGSIILKPSIQILGEISPVIWLYSFSNKNWNFRLDFIRSDRKTYRIYCEYENKIDAINERERFIKWVDSALG